VTWLARGNPSHPRPASRLGVRFRTVLRHNGLGAGFGRPPALWRSGQPSVSLALYRTVGHPSSIRHRRRAPDADGAGHNVVGQSIGVGIRPVVSPTLAAPTLVVTVNGTSVPVNLSYACVTVPIVPCKP
jgi:hypothetical protein